MSTAMTKTTPRSYLELTADLRQLTAIYESGNLTSDLMALYADDIATSAKELAEQLIQARAALAEIALLGQQQQQEVG